MEVAPNESQRAPKSLTREALNYEALFVARWRQSRFERLITQSARAKMARVSSACDRLLERLRNET